MSDLDLILERTKNHWEELRGERIFITGGTGFFGCWLLESFLSANKNLRLKAKAVVLTRTPERFTIKAPHLAQNSAIQLIKGDVRTFRFPRGIFTHVIHAAAADEGVYTRQPLEEIDVTIFGTRRVIEFAHRAGVRKLLFISSGAVYGKQPSDLSRIPEDFSGAPNPLDTTSRYAIPGEAKRIAESICGVAAQQFGLQAKIARCFSFVGPGLPLDGKFAAGNFLRDALAGGPINITGDGSAVRSYMYASDLAEWLWMILFQGTTGNAYNVGSEEEITIRNLAKTIAKACNLPVAIRIMKRHKQSIPAERYVPDTTKIRMELGLRQWVGLKEGICAWRKSVMDCGKANG